MVKQYSQAYYVAKYMKLYSAVFCCIEYGRAAPSRGLPVYKQFPRILKVGFNCMDHGWKNII